MRLQLLSEGYLCCHLKTENIVFILKSNYFLKKFTSQKKKKKVYIPVKIIFHSKVILSSYNIILWLLLW